MNRGYRNVNYGSSYPMQRPPFHAYTRGPQISEIEMSPFTADFQIANAQLALLPLPPTSEQSVQSKAVEDSLSQMSQTMRQMQFSMKDMRDQLQSLDSEVDKDEPMTKFAQLKIFGDFYCF